jgi:hypothetical protein
MRGFVLGSDDRYFGSFVLRSQLDADYQGELESAAGMMGS